MCAHAQAATGRARRKISRKALVILCALAATGLAAADEPTSRLPASEPPRVSTLSPGERIDPLALELFVDGMVRDAMAAEHIAGVAVAIVQNGATTLLKGYGIAGTSPVRAVDPNTTLFRIGSVSKTLTWIALMRQVERGRVQLGTPVNQYLPEELKIPEEGFEKPIRVIDLMSHAAGFDNRDLDRTFAQDPSKLLPLDSYLSTYRPRRVREAGTLSTYSNYGVALAGYVASRVAGESFETLIEQEITKPLGMASTTFRQPYGRRADMPEPMSGELAAQVSEGFTWSSSGLRSHEFEHVMIVPAGSVSSTAADMARFMLMQLDDGAFEGVQIYGEETARAFRTPVMEVPEGVNGWAHGYQVFQLPGDYEGYGHGGATQLFMSKMVLVPDLDLGIFVTTNTNTGNPLVSRLPEEIVRRFYVADSSSVPAGDPDLLRQAHRYEGTYLSTRRAYSGVQKGLGFVIARTHVRVTRDGYLITGAGPSLKRWVPLGAAGHFQEVDGPDKLTFSFDESGRATGWIAQSGTAGFERASPWQSPAVFLLLATLTVAAAIGTWIRWLRARARNASQSRLHHVSTTVSLVVATSWLVFFILLGVAFSRLAGLRAWPESTIALGSFAGIVSAIGTILMLLLLLANTLRTVSGVEVGWSRAAAVVRHAAVAGIYASFAVLLAFWGVLLPWL